MGDTSARNFFYHTVTHIPCSTGIKSLLDGKIKQQTSLSIRLLA